MRSPKRLSSPERRQQILSVATELFSRQGFRGTTTRQIAGRARVNEAILFRHFRTKHDLYWAVIETKCAAGPGLAGLEELLASPQSDRKNFRTLAKDMMERNLQDGALMRLLLFSALEAHELSERFSRTYMVQYYDALAGFIRQRIRTGAFRAVDPMLAARAFLGMIFQYLMACQLFGAKPDITSAAETFTDIWLEGMKKR